MSRFRAQAGPVPLHHQVYLHVRDELDRGTWKPGDRLPPERELTERYACSLITVRRALGDLTRDGRLERMQGRGTFVTQPRIERDLGAALSFPDEMKRRGSLPETRVLVARREPASPAHAAALDLAHGAMVVYLERLRLADGEPLLLEQVWLSDDRYPGLPEMDLERNSLYEMVRERFGTTIARTRESIHPVLLPAREARLLVAPRRTPALLIEGVAYSDVGEPIEHSLTYVRSDRTRYFVERAVHRVSSIRSFEPVNDAAISG